MSLFFKDNRTSSFKGKQTNLEWLFQRKKNTNSRTKKGLIVIQRAIIQSKEGKKKTYNSKRIETRVLIEQQKDILLVQGKKKTANRRTKGYYTTKRNKQEHY